MSKYGPTASDLKFRLLVSIVGLGLMIFALYYRGIPTTAGGWEAIGLAAVFFGGTFLWTLRKLIRRDYPDAEQSD